MQYFLIGLWIVIVAVNVGYYLEEGRFSLAFYDTKNLGWSYFTHATEFQFAFNEWLWAAVQWSTVGIACMLYVPSYIKLRWFKSQQLVQPGNTSNIEIRLLILCMVNSVWLKTNFSNRLVTTTKDFFGDLQPKKNEHVYTWCKLLLLWTVVLYLGILVLHVFVWPMLFAYA